MANITDVSKKNVSKKMLFLIAALFLGGFIVVGLTTKAAADNPYGCPSPHPLIGYGNQGACVKHAQAQLNYLCRTSQAISVDGIFGSATKTRVKGFQNGYNNYKSHYCRAGSNLTVDGIVGSNTWSILDNLPANCGMGGTLHQVNCSY